MNPLRPLLALVLATALSMPGVPGATAAPPRTRDNAAASDSALARTAADVTAPVADNTLIVQLKGRVTADKLSQVYESADTSAGAVGVVRGDVLSWSAPAGESLTDFAEDLEDSGQVLYAEPNYIRQLAGYTPSSFVEPDDPAYTDTYTWGYQPDGMWTQQYPKAKSWWIRGVYDGLYSGVSGVEAWTKGYTGADIAGKYPLRASGSSFKVGVIDTGVYLDHPDAGAYIVAGSSSVAPVSTSLVTGKNSEQERISEVAHGTCVSGIIGATVGNGEGTLGIGRDTKVAVYKVYSGGSGIEDADLIAAVYEAADEGCRVINMSIAGGPYNQALQAAIDYAWSRGCVIVAASGNSASPSVSYPAAMEHVVAVGALGKNGAKVTQRASYSNYGSKLDITAPGSWVWGMTKPGYTEGDWAEPGYTWWDGTSMASPIVAGGVAWLWRAMPDLTNQEIVDLVQGTATDMGAAGKDIYYGNGALNLEAAYNKLMADYPLLVKPTVSVTATPDGRSADVSWSDVPGYEVTYDVAVDGVQVATELAGTSRTVDLSPRISSLRYYRGQLLWSHTASDGRHDVVVTPRSPRNWADGSEQAATTLTTSSGSSHTDSLTIDGRPVTVTDDGTSGVLSTSSLPVGAHTAMLQVTDALGNVSEPETLTFTVRPAPSISRLTGSDRYRYATALSRSVFATATTAVLVGGGSWVDAFSAAPLAHIVRGPVLATPRTTLSSATKAELTRLGVKQVIIVGDTTDVSTSVRRLLAKSYSVTRISGRDRYETANAVARSIAKRSGGTVPDGKVVVVGDSYAAALSASAVAAREGWPLLYTKSSAVPSATRSTIGAIGGTSTLIVGSTGSVSTTALRQLPAPVRIPGSGLSIPVNLATWATTNYPLDFSGERVFVANSTQWEAALGLPATSAEKGGLVLPTTKALASAVKGYYEMNSETAVTTRIVAGTSTVSSTAYNTIKDIVGAP